jgi:TonB-dependent starch-binding outer membrane protein SusC
MLKYFTTLLLCICTAQFALAQTLVKGTVKSSDDDQPIVGTTVVVKSTPKATTTNQEGKFEIAAPQGSILIFSFVGYKTQEIAINNQTTIDVVLESSDQQLDEVVVVGFGTQTRRDLTGSISTIKADQVAQMAGSNFQSNLQGLAPGINVMSSSGVAGAPPRIRIRGNGSIYSNGEPFFVIDGVPVDSDNSGLFATTARGGSPPSNPMANIDPNDIESLEVLKDAAATAIYGARAANGVIIITTKKGKEGKTKFNVNIQNGFSSPTNKLAYISGTEFLALRRESITNSINTGITFNGNLGGVSAAYINGGYDQWFNNPLQGIVYNQAIAEAAAAQNINHFDDVFVQGYNRQITMSASGGNAKTKFFTNIGLYDEQGIIARNGFQRINGRVNLDHKVNDRISLAVQVSGSYSSNSQFPTGGPSSFGGTYVPGGFYAATSNLVPIFPRFNPDGSYFAAQKSLSMLAFRDESLFFNTNDNQRYLTNISGEYLITKNLKFRSEIGNDFISQKVKLYQNPLLTDGGTQQGLRGINDYRTRFTNNFNSNNYFIYNFDVKKTLKGDITTGVQYTSNGTESSFIQSNNLPASPSLNTTQVSGLISAAQNRLDQFAYLSYFLRSNFKISDKYLFSLTGRYDGSSRFGADNRWAFFPSASAAWVISEEKFMKNIESLTFLKLRGSYGISGNSNPGSIEPIAYGAFGINQAFYGDAIGHPYRRIPEIANSVKWEQSKMFDIALDFGFLKDRINGSINYYNRNGDNLILGSTTAPASGTHGSPLYRNIAKMSNSGIEVNVAAKLIQKKFKWGIDVNFAKNTNVINDLSGLPPSSVASGIVQAHVGFPIGTYFLPMYLGVDPATGFEIYADLKKNDDGTIFADANGNNVHDPSKPIVIDPFGRINGTTTTVNFNAISAPIADKAGQPTFNAGFTNTFSYKGLTLSTLFTYIGDIWLYDIGARNQSFMDQNYQTVQSRYIENRWMKPGDIAQNPGIFFDPSTGHQSTRFLEDGSFVRLKNVRLGYDLPKKITKKLRMDRVNIFVNATNLATWTNFGGWDPEVVGSGSYQQFNSQSSNLSASIINADPPQAKTILFGLNVGF